MLSVAAAASSSSSTTTKKKDEEMSTISICAPQPLDLSGLTSASSSSSTTTTTTTESEWLDALLLSSSSSSSSSSAAIKPTTLSALDTTLSSTLHLLDLAATDTAALVDRTMEEIARSVPRLGFDLGVLRENTIGLQTTLRGIRQRSSSSSSASSLTKRVRMQEQENQEDDGSSAKEEEVRCVMEKLRILDLVKSRMEAARDVLREAESWSTLESEVTTLLSDRSYAKAATRLAEAARSMVVFQRTTAEYEGRHSLMVSLQNQLEVALSASLVKAIAERDVKVCRTYFALFRQIEREVEFTAYYFGSRRATLSAQWTKAKLIGCPEEEEQQEQIGSTLGKIEDDDDDAEARRSNLPLRFSDFLLSFHAELHALLNEERTYIPAIFPSPSATFATFIQTTLQNLSPSFPSRLLSLQTHHGPSFLPELIQCYRATSDFALLVDRIMLQVVDAASTALPSSTTAVASTPTSASTSTPLVAAATATATPVSASASSSSQDTARLAKRMSISRRKNSKSFSIGTSSAMLAVTDSSNSTVISGWELALFEPFLDAQMEYAELERSFLALEIARATSSSSNGGGGGGGGGGEMMSYLASGEAERGARVLWERTTKVLLLAEEAMARSIEFTRGYASVEILRVIDCSIVDFMDARKTELDRARKGGERTQVSASSRNHHAEDELELEGLEYSTGDWGTFQFGLRLLEACRSISEKLHTFEGKLKGQLTHVAISIKESKEEATSAVLSSTTTSLPTTPRGAIAMLRQSRLNTVELAKLLDPLDSTSAPSHHQIYLPRGRSAVVSLTRSTQLFLHSTILAPLLAHLNDYASLPSWSAAHQGNSRTGKGAFDLSIPTFSLSPSETISRVGEGLFNLPRLFEVYADDTALGVSIETLPFVDTESLRTLLYPPSPLSSSINSIARHARPISGDPDFIPLSPSLLSHGSASSPASPSLSPAASFPGISVSLSSSVSPSSTATAPNPLSAETVISTWLSSLTLSLLSHLTSTILPRITSLSQTGAAQLATDLAYISNVARALDVESGEDLETWREGVELGGEGDGADDAEVEWRKVMKSKSAEGGGAGLEVWTRIGRIRGWKV